MIDDYINSHEGIIKERLNEINNLIKVTAPEASTKISYGMPTYYLNGNLVHFAANRKHLGFYPAPSAIYRFEKELEKYHTSKGAIWFPYDQPLPKELIKKIVEFRVFEQLAKN